MSDKRDKNRDRKLNLGEIIRKMNIDKGTQEGGEDKAAAQHKSEDRKRVPNYFRDAGKDSETETGSEEELPSQPDFSRGNGQKRKSVSSAPLSEGKGRSSDSVSSERPEVREPSGTAEEVGRNRKASAPLETPQVETPQVETHQESAGSVAMDEEDFDLFKYLSVIIRRKWIIAFFALVAVIVSVYSYATSDKYYIARAKLLFRPDQPITNSFSAYRYAIGRDNLYNTHLELLSSQTVLDDISAELDSSISPSAIKGGLKVEAGKTHEEENDIINASFKYRDPDTARIVLNLLCRSYQEYRREVNTQEKTRFIRKLEIQQQKKEERLKRAEDSLRVFKEKNQIIELSKKSNLLSSKISNMELALQKTRLDILETRERIQSLQKKIGKQDVNVIQSMTYESPVQNKLSDLQLELNGLLADYSEDHFKVRNIRQKINRLKDSMRSEITKKAAKKTMVKNPIREELLAKFVHASINLSTYEAKRDAQEQIIERLDSRMLQMPEIEQRYLSLKRKVKSLQSTSEEINAMWEKARMERESMETDLKILEPARTPGSAVSSKKGSNIFIGLLIGIILGTAVAFLIEYLDQSIKGPEEIESGLELPLLGIVPYIESGEEHITKERLTQSILEPFRSLRENIKPMLKNSKSKVFLLCSAVKGEGKTTLASNLAISFSLERRSILLIDCDLRRPQLHRLFDLKREGGVCEYIQEKNGIDQIVKSTNFDNLYVITSGEKTDIPAELLGSDRFKELLGRLREKFDLIICDSPALIPVSDSMVVAPLADQCIMATRVMWTPLKAAKQAKTQFARLGTRVAGCILNGMSNSHGYYSYYYGYYGYYPYKYSYEYEKDEEDKRSIRKIGLRIESKTGEVLLNIKNRIPGLVALTSSYVVEVVRRPVFWILLVLLAMAGAGVLFMQDKLGGKAGSEDRLAIKKLDTVSSPAFNLESTDMGAEGVDESSLQKDLPDTLPDTICVMKWAEAYNSRDSLEFYSLYDHNYVTFKERYTDSGIEGVPSKLLKKGEDDYTVRIKGFNTYNAADTSFVTEVNLLLEREGAGEEEVVKKELHWHKRDGLWLIKKERRG